MTRPQPSSPLADTPASRDGAADDPVAVDGDGGLAAPVRYRTFVVRVWSGDAAQAWRATVVDVESRAERHFAHLDRLLSHLADESARGPEPA
jgi:hypothetical protein